MLCPKSASSSPAWDTSRWGSVGSRPLIVYCWGEGSYPVFIFSILLFLEHCLTGAMYSIHAWWKESKRIYRSLLMNVCLVFQDGIKSIGLQLLAGWRRSQSLIVFQKRVAVDTLSGDVPRCWDYNVTYLWIWGGKVVGIYKAENLDKSEWSHGDREKQAGFPCESPKNWIRTAFPFLNTETIPWAEAKAMWCVLWKGSRRQEPCEDGHWWAC